VAASHRRGHLLRSYSEWFVRNIHSVIYFNALNRSVNQWANGTRAAGAEQTDCGGWAGAVTLCHADDRGRLLCCRSSAVGRLNSRLFAHRSQCSSRHGSRAEAIGGHGRRQHSRRLHGKGKEGRRGAVDERTLQ
jgi:hypothetical protein